jgi:hypothetical protein
LSGKWLGRQWIKNFYNANRRLRLFEGLGGGKFDEGEMDRKFEIWITTNQILCGTIRIFTAEKQKLLNHG